MAEAEIISGLLKGAVVFLSAGLFVRILCDEYLRQLGRYGLLRSRTPADDAAAERPKPDGSASLRPDRRAR